MGGAIESSPSAMAAADRDSLSKGSSSFVTMTADAATTKHAFPRQRSRGQLARRNSITRGNEGRRDGRRSAKRRHTAIKDARSATSPLSLRKDSAEERPWLGALYFTDLIFIAFTYTINLLRTCGLAELADVLFKGLVYALTQLPYDLYCRWTLSTPPAASAQTTGRMAATRRRKRKTSKLQVGGSSSESETTELLQKQQQQKQQQQQYQQQQHQPLAFTSSHEPEPDEQLELERSPDQLSPFHHIVILLVRFACSNFPHLVPRVLFAEETIGPFVYWRTGGGSNAMVQEFTDLQERNVPVLQMGGAKSQRPLAANTYAQQQADFVEPKFRAYLLSKDARLPLEVQRSNLASRSATTLLYLHGGGFSLGSVAFYAEALLRLRAKICALEAIDGNADNVAEARCVAVEYDLSPAARFPTPLLQCLRCYAHLIEVERVDPSSICIAGDSAGGNLAMGLLLCLDGQMKAEPMLAERDWSKLPMPGKALLISPWVDLRPRHARAFSTLRKEEDKEKVDLEQKDDGEEAKKTDVDASAPDSETKDWAEAVAAFEWDYVASEALLHFAQVYAGVLPSPRRVRGPLGWFAHVCGVLATEYGEEPGKTVGGNVASSFSTDPLGALSALIGPSKKLAQATHDVLSDPFLSRILGLKDVDFLSHAETSQAVTASITGPSSFGPLFTSSDRKTDTVSSKKGLYVPITDASDEGAVEGDEVRKAENLLNSHPLLSPAIGDWRRIKLKGGCLVTWGERERMAEDIEAWVDSVHRDLQSERNAPPAQDGESYHPRDSRTSFEDEEDGDCWIESVVERGPGGVHAWPFVSMYLAGSEAERQRGLDLLADFVARSPVESASTGVEHNPFFEERETYPTYIDPPHAAPESPCSEAGSAGSMPSDVDLHGMIEADAIRFAGPGPAINLVEAARIAHELRSRETSDDEAAAAAAKPQYGLGLSRGMAPSTPPKKKESYASKAAQSPVSMPLPKVSPKQVPKHAPIIRMPQRPVLQSRTSSERERERGRSRSPRRAVHLTPNSVSPATTPPAAETVPHFISSVKLHRPAAMQAQLVPEAVELTRGRQAPAQQAAPLWWTSSADSKGKEKAAPTTPTSVAPPSMREEKGREVSAPTLTSTDVPATRKDRSLEDITEVVQDDSASPIQSASPPSREEAEEEETGEVTARRALTAAPIDISFYGLSPYAIRRPEPEGLSDIAEEGSVLSASVTSAGGGFASRSLSPEDRHIRGDSPQTSLTAASLMLREQAQHQRGGSAKKPRWPLEDDEEGEEDEAAGEQRSMNEAELAPFSPPSNPQPGPSLPLVQQPSTDTASTSASSSPTMSTPRKKPKGDVWW